MNIKQLFKSSLRSLNYHKGRSFLTVLGIIVGITAIIATLAIGHGAEEKMRKQILSIGNNYIEIWPGRSFSDGPITSTKQKPPKKLLMSDITSFKFQCHGIKKISPFQFDRNIIEYLGIPLMIDIKGCNEEGLVTLGRTIKKGIFFTQHHIQKGSRVIILGAQTAKELFKSSDPLGKTIKIKNIHFTVIGVAEKIENYFGMRDPNLDAFIPISASKRYLQHSVSEKINGIVISAKSLDVMPQLVKQLRTILRARHNLDVDEADDFSYIDQQAMLKAAQTSSKTFSLFLIIVASISLLVGGIGVMNIMLVSVTERTKEIGICMALGAPSRIILKQFLIESITLCSIGGLIGIVFGVIAPYIAHYVAGFPVVIKLQSIIIAFFTMFIIGLIFGYYPAHKASKLDPVQALMEI